MDSHIPEIIADGLESEIIPGTLGLRIGVIHEKKEPEEPVNPNQVFNVVKNLAHTMTNTVAEFNKLIGMANAGGSKRYVNDARLKAWEITQISQQIAESLTSLGDALGLHKLNIK